jgi:hypothetical protein
MQRGDTLRLVLAGEPTDRAAGEGVRDGEDRQAVCPRLFFALGWCEQVD